MIELLQRLCRSSRILALMAFCVFVWVVSNGGLSAWSQQAEVQLDTDTPERRQLDFANGWLVRGNNVQAAREYEKFLEKHPNSEYLPEVHYRLGEAYYLLNQYAKAGEILEKALPLQTDLLKRQRALYRLGEVQYHLKKYQASIDNLEKVLAGNPPGEMAEASLFYRGMSAISLDLLDPAVQSFEKIASQYAEGKFYFFSAYQLGKLYQKRSRYTKSLEAYQKIIESQDDKARLPGEWMVAESLFHQGEILYEQKQFEKAIETLRRIRGIGFVELTQRDIVRHRLVQKIVQAYKKRAKAD